MKLLPEGEHKTARRLFNEPKDLGDDDELGGKHHHGKPTAPEALAAGSKAALEAINRDTDNTVGKQHLDVAKEQLRETKALRHSVENPKAGARPKVATL
jgi:hypothetical protein